MNPPNVRIETDFVSCLGCMRRNTIVENAQWGTIEHIELWVPAGPELVVTIDQLTATSKTGIDK